MTDISSISMAQMEKISRARTRGPDDLPRPSAEVEATAAEYNMRTLPDFCRIVALTPYEALHEISEGNLVCDMHDSAHGLGLVETTEVDGVLHFPQGVASMLEVCWRYGLITVEAFDRWTETGSPLVKKTHERLQCRANFLIVNGPAS